MHRVRAPPPTMPPPPVRPWNGASANCGSAAAYTHPPNSRPVPPQFINMRPPVLPAAVTITGFDASPAATPRARRKKNPST